MGVHLLDSSSISSSILILVFVMHYFDLEVGESDGHGAPLGYHSTSSRAWGGVPVGTKTGVGRAGQGQGQGLAGA